MQQSVLIDGRNIYLRSLTKEDATDDYVSWLRDPETTQYLESGRRKETRQSIAEYIGQFVDRKDVLFLAIVLKSEDKHVGNIKLEPINWTHKKAVLGIMIGSPAARGRGVGREAIDLVLRYAFTTLKLHRVGLGVTADNLPAIKCYKKVGFREEGRIRESILRKDRYVDSINMGILDHEYFTQGR